MALKDLLAIVTTPAQEAVFAAAGYLARRWDAHATCLYLARQPEVVIGDPLYTATLWAAVAEKAAGAASAEFDAVKERANRAGAAMELRREDVLIGTVEDVVARHAMHADITIIQAPDNIHEDAVFEAALFRSGRPVLVMPAAWKGETIGRRVMVAWKPNREAARAVADAAPFLSEADQVTVVTIDAKPEGQGSGAGHDISTNLARKGVSVELRNIDGMGQGAEVALMDEARALEADLIVMGGYGHSRLREFVFGGVTRALSRTPPIPVLLSH
jgi:nucleotide-binding universal stress UspA family protein